MYDIIRTQQEQQQNNNNINIPINQTGSVQHNSIYHFHAAKCPQKHGGIAIVQMVGDSNYMNATVWNAAHSMRCYCKMRGYHLYQFDKTGKLVNEVSVDKHLSVMAGKTDLIGRRKI